MDLISIVVPVYNAEKYIGVCVNSVLEQTYSNFELLLINDGSKDNTLEVLKSYKDSRIKVFSFENQGAGKTRNRGIQLSTGKYITFVDSDDYIDKDYLERLHQEIQDNDVLISGYKKVSLEDHSLMYVSNPKVSVWDEFRYVATCGKLYRLDYLKSNGIEYEKLVLGEDVYMNIKCNTLTNKVKVINYAGYNYCYNVNSLTQNKNSVHGNNDILLLLNKIQNTLNLYKYDKKYVDYFYLKTVVQYLLMQANVLEKNSYAKIYKESFNFLKQNDYYHFSLNKEDSFKVNVCILLYVLFDQLHCTMFMYHFIRKLNIKYV